MVIHLLPKQETGVRFSLSAHRSTVLLVLRGKQEARVRFSYPAPDFAKGYVLASRSLNLLNSKLASPKLLAQAGSRITLKIKNDHESRFYHMSF